MKVIGICGSPRKESNTRFFLNIALEKVAETGIDTELIKLRDKNIGYCTGCYNCSNGDGCSIKDDYQEVYEKILEADGVLLGSPVYHGSMTANLKALLDRVGFSSRWKANDMKKDYSWNGTLFSGKVGAPVVVARRAGFTSAFQQLLLWLTVKDFVVAVSHYWNVGVAGKGGAVDAAEDAEGINIIEHLGENVAMLVQKLKNISILAIVLNKEKFDYIFLSTQMIR